VADPHRVYEIRCPVHGFITLNDWEREIISEPAVAAHPLAGLDGSGLSRRNA